MAKINKVAHVVLWSRDPKTSAKFYQDALGMELIAYNEKADMAFLTFGRQHHDIALFKAPEEARPGQGLGLVHVALQVEGGDEELKQMYGRLVEAGAKVNMTMDHGFTHSVYFEDPDGNPLEIFSEQTANDDEGIEYMRTHGPMGVLMDIEPKTPAGAR